MNELAPFPLRVVPYVVRRAALSFQFPVLPWIPHPLGDDDHTGSFVSLRPIASNFAQRTAIVVHDSSMIIVVHPAG